MCNVIQMQNDNTRAEIFNQEETAGFRKLKVHSELISRYQSDTLQNAPKLLKDTLTSWCENLEGILILQYCCNKLPQTLWLKTTKICCLFVRRPEVQNLGVGKAVLPLKEIFPYFLPALVAPGNSWHSVACRCITPVYVFAWLSFSCVSLCLFV